MSPVEIIFILLGVTLIIVSCFIGNKASAVDNKADMFSAISEKEVEKKVDEIIEKRTEEMIVKTDDYLSKISNEKIISMNDFSNQIIEKIENNHNEVVFMYDLLNQKDEEIKKTIHSMDESENDIKEVTEAVVKLTKQLNNAVKKAEDSQALIAETKKAEAAETEKTEKPAASVKGDSAAKKALKEEKTTAGKSRTTSKEKATDAGKNIEIPKGPKIISDDNKNDTILAMHKQGKSVVEISKALGIGQGEVKLVINLYS